MTLRRGACAAVEAFAGSGLLAGGATGLDGARLRASTGHLLPFSALRWHALPASEEVEVLAGVQGPVLDVACGPGRLVAHLAAQGVMAVGIDAAPDAVAAARSRGAAVLRRDLWGALPLEGWWRTVLLFDGNIGIGARPAVLLDRCRRLLAPDGCIVVEVGGPATATAAVEARIEWGSVRSPWFPWATVGVDDLVGVAAGAGLVVVGVDQRGGRCFARLRAAGDRGHLAA